VKLGLARHAPASPCLQEISGLLVTKMPPEQAVTVAQRLGLDLSRCRLDREAHRQGLKAQARRAQSLAQLDTWESQQQLARDTEGPPTQPFTPAIEIDAWNIRERYDWGQTAGQRVVITQRGYVATRLGLEALLPQLYREALQRGLAQAQPVRVMEK